MIEVVIDSIRVSLISQQRLVMLRELDGERQLPIWIGPCEAESISIELQDTEVSRPLTHDLLKNIIEELGASVSFMVINELRDNVFYAQLHLKVQQQIKNIDCRPSDAIAVAIRTKATIFVEESVMDEVAITPELDISEPPPTESGKAVKSENDDDYLDPFRNFLENLDE